jgi:NADH-quinone oxidoreductase subunit C
VTRHLPRIAEREGFAEACVAALGEAYVTHKDHVGELTVTVAREAIVEAARILRDQFGYQQLMEIAGADYPERPERFEVNYHFLSLTENHRVRLKVLTDEETPVPTLTGLWPVAGWLEREVFDMYGVTFAGNVDLRRILTDYGFEGHPLRKDFPQTGYVELRYSEAEKRVVYEPVSLPQDFRSFDFLMPWEGPEYRLPGDEKATPQAPGAPSPAPAPSGQGKTNPPTAANTPKTTDTRAHTGAGAPGDAQAHKEARKPAADKAANAGGKAVDAGEPKPGKKQ